MKNDREREKPLKALLYTKSKIDDDQSGRDYELHNQGGVRRSVTGMNPAHPIRHVGIESCNEGNTRSATHPSGSDSGDGNAEHQGERNSNPANADALCHGSDRLHDSLQNADVALSNGDQQD